MILSGMDRAAVADVDEALTIMSGTDLTWTVLCAPTITTDGSARSDGYRLTDRMPSLLAKVSGPAVAAGLVDLAVKGTATGPVLGIAEAPA